MMALLEGCIANLPPIDVFTRVRVRRTSSGERGHCSVNTCSRSPNDVRQQSCMAGWPPIPKSRTWDLDLKSWEGAEGEEGVGGCAIRIKGWGEGNAAFGFT